MDGKHIIIRPPPNTGSYYFNYKLNFSLVLLAISSFTLMWGAMDGFRMVEYSKTAHYTRHSRETAYIYSTAQQLPSGDVLVPYMIVADDTFPLRADIMKPYSQIGLTTIRRLLSTKSG